jgi:hypothetical protein
MNPWHFPKIIEILPLIIALALLQYYWEFKLPPF